MEETIKVEETVEDEMYDDGETDEEYIRRYLEEKKEEEKKEKHYIQKFMEKNGDLNIETLNILLTYDCCIYGGYIRDIFDDKIPNDIDCVIFAKLFPKCKKDLKKIGYDIVLNKDDSIVKFSSTKKLIPIDMCIEREYLQGEAILAPLAIPDFDVNLLCVCGGKVFNWAAIQEDDEDDKDKNISVEQILSNIKNKKTKKLFTHGMEDRIKKMQNKGYEIINL